MTVLDASEIATRTLYYHSALAMIGGLRELSQEGLRAREVLFLAFDAVGDVCIQVPERVGDVNRLKIGHKLSLPPPFAGRMFYLDAVHPIGENVVIINGDRRIGNLSSMVDVAALVSWFLQEAGDESIFFGCTPHQPGSWWVREEQAEALHLLGFVDIVATPQGLLARRIMDPGLFFLSSSNAVDRRLDQWQLVYSSPLGNVLMLERRLLYGHLVLSCQQGLVEVDLYDLPRVTEAGRFSIEGGFAVVGRISGGAFAVTQGTPMDWGFDGLSPAMLVGSAGCSFMELRHLLRDLKEA